MWKKNSLLNNIISWLCTSVLLFTALCGCTRQPNVNGNTVTFIDALQRQVTVEKSPARVAALLGSFADVWLLAGGTVCATAEDAWSDFGYNGHAVNLGGAHSPSLERLLSSSPSFVLASASTAADVQMKESLEAAGITVAYFDVDSFNDFLKMLDICTNITGRKDLYNTHGLRQQERIESVKKQFQTMALSEHEKTILLLRASSGSVKAKGSEGTVLGEMLADIGCINIADSDSAVLESLSAESILRQDPYRVFAVTMGNDVQKARDNLNKTFCEHAAFQTMDAVKNHRVYLMEKHLFNLKPNGEWAKAYETLVNVLLEKQ